MENYSLLRNLKPIDLAVAVGLQMLKTPVDHPHMHRLNRIYSHFTPEAKARCDATIAAKFHGNRT